MSTALTFVGAVAALVFVMGLLGFLMMKRRGGRLANTPFVQTGTLATNGDAVCGEKNAISTEGRLIQPGGMLTSPVEGKACLMYRLEVSASWKAGDDDVRVQMLEEKQAVDFQLDDGSGPVTVSPGTSGDFEPLHKFRETKGKGLKSAFTGGGVKFGPQAYEVHPGGRYKGKLVPDNARITVQETCLLPADMFYANGKWEDGAIRAHSWSSLILTNTSRDEALASTLATQKNAKFAAIGGGILAPICLGLGLLLAPSPNSEAGSATSDTKPAQTDAGAEAHKSNTGATNPQSDPSAGQPSAPAADPAPEAGSDTRSNSTDRRSGSRKSGGKRSKTGKRKR